VTNVFCFYYGTSNNFEVKTAKRVSKKLGYEWIHILLSVSNQKKYFKENAFNDFLEFADTLSNAQV